MTANPSVPTLRTRRTKTWSSFAHLGRKPNEYEIVTHGMNHTIGATPLELGPDVHGNQWLARHRDNTGLKVAQLDAFRDPDKMTYRKYTQAMDEQETYVDGLLQHYSDVQASDAALGQPALDLLATAMAPARYLGHGLQMISAYVQQLAHSSYIGNCAAFQTADQLRRVQRVAYRTRQLANAHPQHGFGSAERKFWEGDADWQPTREAIERLMLAFDWDQAFVGLNLVVKPVVDELFLKTFAELARETSSELDALIAENLYLDAQRSRRWTADACRSMTQADAGNAGALHERLALWRPHAEAIIASGSRLLARHATNTKAEAIADRVALQWDAFLADTGLGAQA
ncbi:MAG TPA: toluene hydroxylase [Burkholderiaceae bacterium]|nr:toluene hydroxylase [Burkholderiaceae bacterium]